MKPFEFVWFAFFILFIASTTAHADEPMWETRGMPYAIFETLPVTHVNVGGATLDIAFTPGNFDLPKTTIVNWIAARARMVADYYGHFPVKKLQLLIISTEGNGIPHGTSYGYGGGAIKLALGRHVTQARLDNDWVLVHEMVHLAFPSQVPAHLWIEEGIATYVEPIARTQAGQMNVTEVWRQLVDGIHKGLPNPGDEGLDNTHTWGRTYWGGALFCLLADIEIRRRTNNKYGLRDALRAVTDAGGSIEEKWPLEEILKIGDGAVGVPVLSELYQSMKAMPVETDLTSLWHKLGVAIKNGDVIFDDSAPLAAVRRGITAASLPDQR